MWSIMSVLARLPRFRQLILCCSCKSWPNSLVLFPISRSIRDARGTALESKVQSNDNWGLAGIAMESCLSFLTNSYERRQNVAQ